MRSDRRHTFSKRYLVGHFFFVVLSVTIPLSACRSVENDCRTIIDHQFDFTMKDPNNPKLTEGLRSQWNGRRDEMIADCVKKGGVIDSSPKDKYYSDCLREKDNKEEYEKCIVEKKPGR